MASKLYKKAFNNGGSLIWRGFFWISIIFKVVKWLFKKAQPKTDQQIDLEPGEYHIVVKDLKTEKKKNS